MSELKNQDGQLRHSCPGGHQRLVAKTVNGKLEFVCDSCKVKYYWSPEFLQMLITMLKVGTDFKFTFE